MTHVVIGGAGFIGVNLADALLADGEDVVVIDNFSRAGTLANIEWLRSNHPGVRVMGADIRSDVAALRREVIEASAVYHLAAQVAVTTSVVDPRSDFETNALGTFNVLEAMREVGSEAPLVYASTNKVYGGLESVPVVEEERRYRFGGGLEGVDESFPLDLHSPYGCSKGAGDQYVRDYARIYGLRTVVFRQSCIYGPRQFGIEDQGWLAWFIIAAVVGRPLTLYGNGKQVRDLLHVRDLIDLFRRAVAEADTVRGRVYNIGGGPSTATSLLEAIELIERHLGVTIDPAHAEIRPGDQPIYISDIQRARDELGWEPTVDVKTGIGELADWVEANRALFEPALSVSQR